jgi:hypothetical protein
LLIYPISFTILSPSLKTTNHSHNYFESKILWLSDFVSIIDLDLNGSFAVKHARTLLLIGWEFEWEVNIRCMTDYLPTVFLSFFLSFFLPFFSFETPFTVCIIFLLFWIFSLFLQTGTSQFCTFSFKFFPTKYILVNIIEV